MTKISRLSVSALLILLLCAPLLSANIPASSLNRKIDNLIRQPAYKNTTFSIHVVDLTHRKTRYSLNPDTPLCPASNMKLITTAAALDRLGPTFTYNTIAARIDDDLVIFASGDPLIGDPRFAQKNSNSILHFFETLYQQLKNRNMTLIKGDLIIDATFFDDQRFHPSWPTDQADKWYTAQVAALNFNDNCLDITFIPAANPLQTVYYALTPATAYVNLSNKCLTTHKGSNKIGASRLLNTNRITLFGSCRTRQTLYVTIDNPARYFGFLLAEYLEAKGLHIQGRTRLAEKPLRDSRLRLPPSADILLNYKTPLADVLAQCNQRSLNFAAECVLKTVAAYHNPPAGATYSQGSWTKGQDALNHYLKQLNIPSTSFLIDDGSGLSRKNRLSARTPTTDLTA
ncbi:MAG: D-alanyl-D-alanine carboxypeptidase/D-alanyl-D-alanine-endopeptidase, partial [Planctomycetes bacterium]|nr:D-alanyl-D-alanine carboxypeptidase/D-alanyl-D-alanine-endopeptidase [Planctomycetota bacterium]